MLNKIAELYGEFYGWRIRVIERWIKNFRLEAIKLLAGGRGYVLNINIVLPRGYSVGRIFPCVGVTFSGCDFLTGYYTAKKREKAMKEGLASEGLDE
jgi:hypothetical protein